MKITRRDFVNGTLAGSGAALLSSLAPGSIAASSAARTLADDVGEDWYGYGGVGDYARSHGNTPELINIAHDIRDGIYNEIPDKLPVDEEYDVVVVGGGMTGLGAAWHFKKHGKTGQNCLVLDNHPIFGGESKENEFNVNGEKLLAPQGANGFFVPPAVDDPEKSSGDSRYYAELNIPRDLSYRNWSDERKPLNFCRDNYQFLHPVGGRAFDTGYFYDSPGGGAWHHDILSGNNDIPEMPATERKDLLNWVASRRKQALAAGDFARLDAISYKEYLQKEFKLGPAGASFADHFLAASFGLGSDAVSAYTGSIVGLPGTVTEKQYQDSVESLKEPNNNRNSFPGGNSGFARYFLKNIKPSAIAGSTNFEDIILGKVNFNELDKPGDAIRIRLRSSVVSVKHEGEADNAKSVSIVYSHGGKLRRIRAKGVVMASGGWVNKYIVKDLPDEIRNAYQEFVHAPFLVANVALTNWRFMYRLGLTGARWAGGFGSNCNIRNPMLVGNYQPPLDPDKPTVLTFYVPLYYPDLPARAQAIKGRMELFFTDYPEYEQQIIRQMNRLFASGGFNASKDVSGIILNRWGHAYVVPTPGFMFDTPEKRAPRNIIMEGFGRVAFGHSELEGFQHWGPAADQGRQAVQQVLDSI